MKKREDNFQNNHNAKQNQVRKFQLDAIAGKGSRPEAGRAFVQRGHGKKKKKAVWQRVERHSKYQNEPLSLRRKVKRDSLLPGDPRSCPHITGSYSHHPPCASHTWRNPEA